MISFKLPILDPIFREFWLLGHFVPNTKHARDMYHMRKKFLNKKIQFFSPKLEERHLIVIKLDKRIFWSNYFFFQLRGHTCVNVSFDHKMFNNTSVFNLYVRVFSRSVLNTALKWGLLEFGSEIRVWGKKCRGRCKKMNKREINVNFSVFNNSIVLVESAMILALKWGVLNSCGNDTFSDTTKNVKTCKPTHTQKIVENWVN